MIMITVELNPHYKDEEMSLQCGATVYADLRHDGGLSRGFLKQVNDGLKIRRMWRIACHVAFKSHTRYVQMKGKVIRFSYIATATVFLDYLECQAVAFELVASGSFSSVQIVEYLTDDSQPKELKFAD